MAIFKIDFSILKKIILFARYLICSSDWKKNIAMFGIVPDSKLAKCLRYYLMVSNENSFNLYDYFLI